MINYYPEFRLEEVFFKRNTEPTPYYRACTRVGDIDLVEIYDDLKEGDLFYVHHGYGRFTLCLVIDRIKCNNAFEDLSSYDERRVDSTLALIQIARRYCDENSCTYHHI